MAELQGFYYVKGRTERQAAPVILLHGSGQDERELIALAGEAAPQRPYLALRGRIAWERGFAFFRRNADRSLDYQDIEEQTAWFGLFIKEALDRRVLREKPVLLGFSNGAILASSLLLRQPELVSGAVLMRPLSPAPDERFPDLAALPVLITAGEKDERRVPDDVRLMDAQLRAAGATVTTHILPTGHGPHADEGQLIRAWLDNHFSLSVTARKDM